MSRINKPFVTLVGAGPGDPDLISVAGVRALKEANVVLYDALVHPSILDWAFNAEKIFVGKRKGYKRFSQDQINDLLVIKALEKGHVVRLKGGDPFVFGRGSEEIIKLNEYGIPSKVIPGISSATSAPVTQGIPLTLRGISRSFWVLTATIEDDQLSNDLHLAASSSATVVILMGMSKLNRIVSMYQSMGKGDEAICIIQSAFMVDQKSVIGKINNIVSRVEEHQISNPAVIVIGEVVNHRHAEINELLIQSSMKKVS